MTTITYHAKCHDICIEGHANSGPVGEDLICCAVSTLAHTLQQTLEDFNIDYALHSDETIPVIHIIGNPSDDIYQVVECTVAFQTVACGLRGLAANYPEYITYNEYEGG